MLKKIAAIGVSVAIAFAPLAALAQTDQAAPAPGAAPAAGDQGSMAAPMKKKTHHHMSSSKMKKPMAPFERSGRWSSRREPTVVGAGLARLTPLKSTASSSGRGGFVFRRGSPLSPHCAPCQTRRQSRGANGERGILVRVREHLLLSGRAACRRARGGAGRELSRGGRSCSARYSRRKAGGIRRSIYTPPRAATCGATLSAYATQWVFRSSGPSRFRSRACSPRGSRWRSRAISAQTSRVKFTSPNSAKGWRSPSGPRSPHC